MSIFVLYFSKLNQQFEIQIIEFLKRKIPEILGIYVFGSFADNTNTVESDIDIAFLTFQKISQIEKWKTQEELASILNRDVDLVDLKDATIILRAEVIEKGKLIFSADSYQIDYFEMTTYSMYADLNETRMDILTDYKERYGRNSD